MVAINTHTANTQAYNNNLLYKQYGINPNINYLLNYQDICKSTNTINITGVKALYVYGISIFKKQVGNPTRFTPEQAKERINARRRKKYAKQVEQYKKDTDKTLSNHKNILITAYKDFYSKHYPTNYFITLQHGFLLDSWDKQVSKTSEDYKIIRNQDKYQIHKFYNEQQCYNEALEYIKRLTKEGKPIFDYWYLTIHKSHYDGSYHAHIAINITNITIKNVHTYLQNRWHKSQRKKQMVKKIHNNSELIGYMLEEKKRINGELVSIECNIDKHSNRLVSQLDLTKHLDYSLNTYVHSRTQSKLQQFKKVF